MVASARKHGLLVYPLEPSLDGLLQEVAAGHPVLVFQNLGLSWLPRHHFAVLVGYDIAREQLVLRSGTTRELPTTFHNFLQTWTRAGRQAWVMLTPGQLPASAQPGRYLQAAWALEQTAGSDIAIPAWHAATNKWPASAMLFQASGNAHYASADYPAASKAYLAALSLSPADAGTWNNFAYTLLALGCRNRAIDAARCAYRLAPEENNCRDTLAEISAWAGQQPAVNDCPELPACI